MTTTVIAARRKCGTYEQAIDRACQYANRRDRRLDTAIEFLERAGWADALYDVESVSCGDKSADYLNAGDTYSSTILDTGGDLFVSSWGEWHEQAESEYCAENGAVRCGYCGEFTDCAEEWHNTVCSHCGRFVDDGAAPPAWSLRFYPHTGLGAYDIETADYGDRDTLRSAAADMLRDYRAAGNAVIVIDRGAKWELCEPEDSGLIGDDCGILAIAAPSRN